MRIGSLFILVAIVAIAPSANSEHIDGASVAVPRCNIWQYKPKIAELERQAARGSAEQMFCIGYYYYSLPRNRKSVIPKSERLALKWFTKSANQGLASAAWRMGEMHMKGYGASRDYELAIEWFLKASQMGDHLSGASIAGLFFNGKGFHGRFTPYSPEWYREAGSLSKRTYGFGPMFTHYGKKNGNRQFEFLKNAAKVGIITAQLDLAYYYDCRDTLKYSAACRVVRYADSGFDNTTSLNAVGVVAIINNSLALALLDPYTIASFIYRLWCKLSLTSNRPPSSVDFV